MSVAQAMYFNTNFLHSTLLFFCNHTENPISSKTDEGKPQLLQQKEAFREVKEKADEGKTQVLQQEEASKEVKENEAQKNRK